MPYASHNKQLEYLCRWREENKNYSFKYNKEYYEKTKTCQSKRNKRYFACVKKPSCDLVGNHGAKFYIFNCGICGVEVRRLLSKVNWQYDHFGILPKFCSLRCCGISRRKNYESSYAKKIKKLL